MWKSKRKRIFFELFILNLQVTLDLNGSVFFFFSQSSWLGKRTSPPTPIPFRVYHYKERASWLSSLFLWKPLTESLDWSPFPRLVKNYEQLALVLTATAFSILICFLAGKEGLYLRQEEHEYRPRRTERARRMEELYLIIIGKLDLTNAFYTI